MAVACPPSEARQAGVARRPYPRLLSSPPLVEVNVAQAHLWTRFEGLLPEDVSNKSFAMYSSQGLASPKGFEHIWLRTGFHRTQRDITPEERTLLHSVAVVLVLSDITKQNDMEDVEQLAGFLKLLFDGQVQPHILLVHHSYPESPSSDGDMRYLTWTRLLRSGISDAILDEPASFKLAWAVRNRLLQHDTASQEIANAVLCKTAMLEYRNEVKMYMDDTIWGYLRVRLDSGVPQVDPSIPDGEPHEIDGFEVGKCLGSGSLGKVCKLKIAGEYVGEVVKMVRKSTVKGINDLEALQHHIKIMTLFSTEEWKHPHIAKLIGMYHSRTHIFFRMDDAGSENLFKRLCRRDQKKTQAPLSSIKVGAIMEQIASAIRHMHRACTAHLDIKPENIIVSETFEEINVKVMDFDTAVTEPVLPFTGCVGTHPFIAPEIVLKGRCDPFAADIWSMAIVFLELACRVGVLDDALSLHLIHGTNQKPQRKLKASKISGFFGQRDSVCRLLTNRLRPELQDLMGGIVHALTGMLEVKGSSRWNSEKVMAIFDQP